MLIVMLARRGIYRWRHGDVQAHDNLRPYNGLQQQVHLLRTIEATVTNLPVALSKRQDMWRHFG